MAAVLRLLLVGLLLASCAPARVHSVRSPRDGAEMVLVPAGPFRMGSEDGDEDERPLHVVDLPAFYIDRYPVTNGRFVQFLRSAGFHPRDPRAFYVAGQAESGLSWDGSTWQVIPGREDYPVNGVSYYGAEAYARWAGRRLPTEAEWEKAARGTDARAYPWGNEWDPRRANGDGAADGFPGLAPVGAMPGGASPYGAEDMGGTLWEWVASRYRPYPYVATDGRERAGPEDARVNRGGSWRYDSARWSSRIANRGWDPPEVADDDYGFRCAASADGVEP